MKLGRNDATASSGSMIAYSPSPARPPPSSRRFLAPARWTSGEGEDAVGDAAGNRRADADGEDAVQPQVVRGAGLEDGRGVEVVLVAVHRLALVQLFPGLLGSGEDAAVGGVDEGAVVGLEGGG